MVTVCHESSRLRCPTVVDIGSLMANGTSTLIWILAPTGLWTTRSSGRGLQARESAQPPVTLNGTLSRLKGPAFNRETDEKDRYAGEGVRNGQNMNMERQADRVSLTTFRFAYAQATCAVLSTKGGHGHAEGSRLPSPSSSAWISLNASGWCSKILSVHTN